MANTNPGPAIASNTPGQSLTTQQAPRLIGVAKAVNLTFAGDTLMALIGDIGLWAPTVVVTANSSGTTLDIHLATVGVYTAVSQGGTVVLTTAALTSQTTQTYVKIANATNPATAIVGTQYAYVNVGTTVSGGVVDVYVFGYDLT